MKLKEIITNLDTSVNNEDDNVYWYLESFVNEFGLSCYNLQQCQNNIRLKSYWVANHLCTDTRVGIKAYFLDDEFVCMSTKTNRNDDEHLQWLDEVSYRNVKNYIISLQEDEGITPPRILNMEEDFGEGYPIQYTGQCLKRNVLWKGIETVC
jgi:hypothetical protein